jgi:hypothetical protein
MIKHVLVAGALAAVLITAGAAHRSAEALPVPGLQADTGGGVTLVRHGGFGGGGFHGFRGGGGIHSFRGPVVRSFRGPVVAPFGRRSGGSYIYGGHHHGHHHHRGIRIYPGYAPYYYSDYYGDYYDSDACSWLRYKAERTGSRYWWHRYRRCVAAYY